MMGETVARGLYRLQPMLWRGGELCLLAYLFLVPFPSHTATARAGTLGAALILWVLALASEHSFRWRRWSIDRWVLAYVIVVVTSTLISADLMESVRQFRSSGLKHLAVYLLVTEQLRRGADVHWLLATSLASSSLIALYGYWSFWWLGITSDGRPVSVFFYHNDLSHYLLLPSLILVWYLIRERDWALRPAWGALLVFHLGLLVLVQTRASMVAFVTASGVMALTLRRRLLTFLLACILGVALPLGILGDGRMWDRYGSIFRWETYATEQARMRGEAWRTTLRLIESRPLLGYGYGWKGFRTQVLALGPEDPAVPGGVIHPHNIFLEIAFESGMLGLVAFLGLWLNVVVLALRNIRQRAEPFISDVNTLALGVFLAAFLVGLTDIGFWYERLGTFTWLFIGIVAATGELASRGERSAKQVVSR